MFLCLEEINEKAISGNINYSFIKVLYRSESPVDCMNSTPEVLLKLCKNYIFDNFTRLVQTFFVLIPQNGC